MEARSKMSQRRGRMELLAQTGLQLYTITLKSTVDSPGTSPLGGTSFDLPPVPHEQLRD
ncbi:hypothetical protein BKA82DRAFT_1006463 [Pisolithus tinctorius]|uniref:Uncharacterized protein n=1 Tax=Pisolithus tinctorius Marx 270 TaxID=870435 RepID=A0A0C3IIQ7_PISTI|nr:hypothetical protein BKA82DRAFT_1006463 [Pisolithus tinctorius]KIN96857.1 hypothetical protein M404DRAFT_1006463 [Pisolithus tinctorius Marx 270]